MSEERLAEASELCERRSSPAPPISRADFPRPDVLTYLILALAPALRLVRAYEPENKVLLEYSPVLARMQAMRTCPAVAFPLYPLQGGDEALIRSRRRRTKGGRVGQRRVRT